MATYNSFEELPIWQRARELNKEIIAITKMAQVCKDFRFCSQIKAAAGSVMDNIAEGFERDSNFEFINHLSYSKGSIGEVRSQLYRAFDESFISQIEQKRLNEMYAHLGSDIANLIRYLNKCEVRGLKFAGRQPKPNVPPKSAIENPADSLQKSEIKNQKSEINLQ